MDEAVLAATRHLLAERGYQQTTIQAVARLAAVSPPSIYRRWANREALIEDAVFRFDAGELPIATGDLRNDLLAWTRQFLAVAADPAARTGIPGLLSNYLHDRDAYRGLVERGEEPTRVALREILEQAVASGQAAPDCDPDVIYELLRGSTMIRGLTMGNEDGDRFCQQITGALLAVATQPNLR
jgi:AcrR family transcriptional regulator